MKTMMMLISAWAAGWSVWAAGENLLVNPGFEESSCPASSNSGNWGWYKDGAIVTPGWRGGANAGIAKTGNPTWKPTGTGTWTAYIQRYKPWGAGLNSYIEQTVHVTEYGAYEFAFDAALRATCSACQIGLSVSDGTTTTEYGPATCSSQVFAHHVYRVTLQADRDYTFRLHGFDSDLNDTTAMIDDCSLVYIGDVTTPAAATWTGARGTTDVLDAGNWDCFNFLEEKIADALPQGGTVVTIPETSNFACPVGTTNLWREIVFDGTVLQTGNDLAGLDFSRAKGTLDLNGRSLVLTEANGISYRGELTVQNSAAGEPVTVRFTTGAGAVVTNNALAVRGNVELAKDGAGDLQWGGSARVASEVPIAITAGRFLLGEKMVDDLFGSSGTVTISGTGQLDQNGKNVEGLLAGRVIYFEGDGPDGTGALSNRGASSVSSLWKDLVMTGDATIGGISRFECRLPESGISGEDYTLTVKNQYVVALCGGASPYLRVKKLLISDGGVYAPCLDDASHPPVQEITEGILLTNGGCFEPWTNRGLIYDLRMPIVVGSGGGLIGGFSHDGDTASRGDYFLHGGVVVCAGSRLELGYSGGWYAAITNEVGATISMTNTTSYARSIGSFLNAGTIEQTAGELSFGSPSAATQGTVLVNDGTIRAVGGTFLFNAASTISGAGTLELAGAQTTLAGSFAGYAGTVRIAGGTVAFAQPGTLTSTLVLEGGQVTADLSSFRGTAVIDLAAKEGLFDTTGRGWNTLKGLTVTVNLAGRTPAFGEKLLAWSSDEKPEVTFVADAETAAGGVALVATPTGLFYGADPASTVVDQAHWTGAANDGDWTNPQNWSCQNAAGATVADGLPGTMATVFMADAVKVDIPAARPLVCARLELKNCALAADCDWRGLDLNAIPPDTVLDLHGHKLLFARGGEALTTSFTVTDTQQRNYIQNGSFEEQTAISANKGAWGRATQVSTSAWRFGNQGGGLSNANGTWTTNVRDGSYYGILQVWDAMGSAQECWIAQTVTVPADGLYRLSFANMARPTYSSVLQIDVRVDGSSVSLITPPSKTAWDEMVGWLDLTAGDHEIRFVGVRPATSGDYVAFIDRVALTRVAEFGELHFEVPEGANFVNDKIVLTGNLRFVKDGAGTFTAARNNQGCLGGTEVTAGVLTVTGNPASWPFGGNGIVRAGAALVKVDSEAVLDLNGKAGWGYHTIDFAGGTVRGATWQFNAEWRVSAGGTLEDTGTLTSSNSGVNLQGNTLSISIVNTLTPRWTVVSNGLVDVVSGGWFAVSNPLDMRTADLRMNAAFNLTAALDVRDYYAKYAADFNQGTAPLTVWGRFTPASDYFYGCMLQNGAVLDLTEQSGEWSTTSKFKSGANTVTFADEATITVDLGSRRVTRGGRIVAWDTPPENLATLTFELAAPRKGWLEKLADGVYYRSGLLLIVR